MTLARFFDWFQLAALAFWASVALRRMVGLYRRGVRVVAMDWQRTPGQMAEDSVTVICFLLWWYELVAYALPLRVHLPARALGNVLFGSIALKLAGVGLTAAGLVIWGLALRAFGESWRIGLDRETPGPLATGGVFGWSRNPLFLSFDLLTIGVFLIQGRLIFLGLALGLVVMLHRQILREERFLAQTYGEAYQAYCARVRRYVTWPGMSKRN